MDRFSSLPAHYQEYLKTGIRTKEIELDHWAEVTEVMLETTGYNHSQLGEKVGTKVHTRLVKSHLPVHPERLLKRMKAALKEEKRINIYNHRRVWI